MSSLLTWILVIGLFLMMHFILYGRHSEGGANAGHGGGMGGHGGCCGGRANPAMSRTLVVES